MRPTPSNVALALATMATFPALYFASIWLMPHTLLGGLALAMASFLVPSLVALYLSFSGE